MKRRQHGPEEVICKPRAAEAMGAVGQSAGQVCQKLGISERTLARRKKLYRGRGDDHIRKCKAMEEENRRLKKAVADLTLDKQILKEAVEGRRFGAAQHKD